MLLVIAVCPSNPFCIVFPPLRSISLLFSRPRILSFRKDHLDDIFSSSILEQSEMYFFFVQRQSFYELRLEK